MGYWTSLSRSQIPLLSLVRSQCAVAASENENLSTLSASKENTTSSYVSILSRYSPILITTMVPMISITSTPRRIFNVLARFT